MEQRKTDSQIVTPSGAPIEPQAEAKANGRAPKVEHDHAAIKDVRASDIEPYTGLRYLSKLFRFMAIILLLLLVAEIATGLYTQGAAALATLLGEASRLIVLAGVLWGTGDLAHLLIDVGHDVRASRILLARQVYRTTHGAAAKPLPSDALAPAEHRLAASPGSTPP